MRPPREDPTGPVPTIDHATLLVEGEKVFRWTAQRNSLCAEDAEDAFQAAAEVLLRKRPQGNRAELYVWMKVVTMRQAVALKLRRERDLLESGDPVELADLFAEDGPSLAERIEQADWLRLGLEAVEPSARRCLVLRAQGYSRAEIEAIEGLSTRQLNRRIFKGNRDLRAAWERAQRGER